ncbi:MAG: YggT family protein [Gammaproteobacteria bacterium]|nr:YggT family protein [Gammaproteobacteria bacterium]
MTATLLAGFVFLIGTVFDMYLCILITRVILAWRRSNAAGPMGQFIIKLTRPIVYPLKKWIRDLGNIETASLVLIFFLEMIKWFLILLPIAIPHVLGLIILSIGDALELTLDIFFYAILLQAILSWVQPGSPMNRFLQDITAPIIQPFQRLIPPIGGLDISPIPALIVLQLLMIILTEPVTMLGRSIAFG